MKDESIIGSNSELVNNELFTINEVSMDVSRFKHPT